jgi:predicted Zn-dependent protease
MKLIYLLPLLVACAGRPPPSPSAARPAPRAEPAAEREAKLGRSIDEKIASRIGFYGDRRVAAYVERVGRSVSRSALARVTWTFRVVDDGGVNAFAAPGGFVYVTRGMLAHLDSEAELAAILGHEVAHVARRHSLREEAWADDREASWSRADTLRFYERSRDNEREADALAVSYLTRAGYPARALAAALERLAAVERAAPECADEDEDGWLSSHPNTQARVARAEHAAGLGRGATAGLGEHWAVIDGLAYGDNPRRGFLEGARYVMPQAALAFELPSGFTVGAAGSMLWAASADSGTVLFLMRAYRADDAEQAPQLVSPVWIRVAGHRAVFGELQLERSELVGGAAVIWLPREIVLLLAVARGDARRPTSLPELLGRFSKIEDGRLLERPPRRIRVARLSAAASVTQLAVRSGLSRSEIALLNGVSAAATVPSGSLVKLVD